MTGILLVAGCVVGQAGQALEFPALELYRHSCRIGTEHDRFSNGSVYYAELGRLTPRKGVNLFLVLRYELEGLPRKAADANSVVRLLFHHPSRAEFFHEYSLLRDHDVFILFDGARIDGSRKRSRYALYADEATRRKGNRMREQLKSNPPAPGLDALAVRIEENRAASDLQSASIETATVDVPIMDFLRFSKARSVECRVGPRVYRLTPEQCAGMRDFAARLAFDDGTVRAKLDALAAQSPADGDLKKRSALTADKAAQPPALGQAETRMRMARQLERLGNTAGAVGFYQQVVDRFPGMPQAADAKERIKALAPKRPTKKPAA